MSLNFASPLACRGACSTLRKNCQLFVYGVSTEKNTNSANEIYNTIQYLKTV